MRIRAGTPLFAFVACGGGTGSIGVTEAGAEGSPGSSTSFQQCRTEKTDANPANGQSFVLELLGDTGTCEFDDSGTGSQELCKELCGRSYCQRSGSSVTCYSQCFVDGRRHGQLDDRDALRAFFGEVAKDESRHAALAHRVDAWLKAQLSPAAQARVAAARTQAQRDLARADAGAARGVDRRRSAARARGLIRHPEGNRSGIATEIACTSLLHETARSRASFSMRAATEP